MTLTIITLTPDETFLQTIDPELCEIKETHEAGGLRTIDFTYKFQKYEDDRELFKLGNKLWIQGDINLTDCLYVVNTEVQQDLYKENSFSFEAEEVLVELNNAPLVSHLDFTAYPDVFHIRTVNGAKEVKIDWNSLNYWFGNFFNLGVIQECLNSELQWIPFYGTYNLMSLLRFIEEQTGNVFVTRYEKDILDNTIHRYLDFLNPINANRDWELHMEYDFAGDYTRKFYASDGVTETTEDKPWEVVRYTNSHVPTGQSETVLSPTYDAERDEAVNQYDTLDTSYTWNPDDENVEDEDTKRTYEIINNFVPANIDFRIVTKDGELLNADGVIYTDGDDNPLKWTASDIGLTTSNTSCLISLFTDIDTNTVGLTLNNRSFAIVGDNKKGIIRPTYVSYTNSITENVDSENQITDYIIPDDSYLMIYDHVNNKPLFKTCINRSIGTVHTEVLDFGFNIDNIQFDIDEADVYTGVAPILQYTEDNNSGLTRSNFNDLVSRYHSLSISKGDRVPMIMQKINVTAASLEAAKMSFNTTGSISYIENSGANESILKSNYWIRPYKPQDQSGSYEFLRATAYWNAPYDKHAEAFDVQLSSNQGIEYGKIYGRPDDRDDRRFTYDKIGTTESSDEDIFSIYNQCALYLKDHCYSKVELDVDVANLQNGKYNDYNLHDKVYIKVPETSELITATVVETSKEANNIAANTIKLSNYTTNVLKQITDTTVIHASNVNYNYPNSKTLTIKLENLNYDEDNPWSLQYPPNKLVTFTLYRVKDGQRTFKKIYTKTTNSQGYAYLPMKYDPGEFNIDISFGGDEEFSAAEITIRVSVGGTKQSKTTKKTSGKNKTTKKSTSKVTKTTYYDKYGRSPDKKKLLAIGRISASGDEGLYKNFYGMEFKNKCPKCGKEGTLFWDIFWAGNEHSNNGKVRLTGNLEGSSAEGAIFCQNPRCDGDWSVQGREHGYTNTRLTTTKKRFLSSKADAYKLKKGKYVYNKALTTNTAKNNANSKNRKVIGSPSQKVRNTALSIVDNKTGYKALRAICDWMDKNIHYKGYRNFQRSPDTVLSTKHGNCCDQTRLILQLFDAAGLTEYYDLYYVNLSCPSYGHVYGRIKSKKTGKWTNIDPASDSYGCYGYVCDSCSRTSPVDSKYPHMPF